MLLDSHVHLTDSELLPYFPYILAGMKKMGIASCSVTVDVATSNKSLELFGGYREHVKQFIGIHPEAAEREYGQLDAFEVLFHDNIANLDGVGEIGLDRTYVERGVSYEKQNAVFCKMLELAERGGKPVSIHSRRSLDDILAILGSYKVTTLLHWFAGSKKQLAKCMDMHRVFVSYGPALLYADDKKVLLQNSRPDRVLIETDGPVRYSRCFRDLPSMPTSFLVSVLAETSRVMGKTVEETKAMLEANASSYLGTG